MTVNPMERWTPELVDRVVKVMEPDVEYTLAQIRDLLPGLNPITVAQCVGRAAGEKRIGTIRGVSERGKAWVPDRYVRA